MRSKSRKHPQNAIRHVALPGWIFGLSALLLLFPTMCRTQNRAPADPALTATERQHMLNVVIDNLGRYYFDGTVAKKTAEALRAHWAAGEYAGKTAPEFAALLTRHMREASGDMHLVVDYSREPIRLSRPQPSTEDLARRRIELGQMNCTIQKPEILPGNIGYLKFDFFPDLSTCSERFAAAMSAVDRTDALVFDLRDNRGGMPDTVSFVASYLFDHPEYLVNPRDGTTENSWTRSPVAGSHLAQNLCTSLCRQQPPPVRRSSAIT